MWVDGVVFLIDEYFIIGLIFWFDIVDNFWFMLMYEIGYVILYYCIGLVLGFFDDFEYIEIDELEEEVN